MGRRVHAGVALQATSLPGLFQGGSDTFAIGPGIFWAAFDLGGVRARLRAADARTEAALAHYEQHVLLARGDTGNALVTFTRQQARRDALWASAQASKKTQNLVRERYQSGVADFLTVLDAERTLLAAQDQLADSETLTATALVAVYKALGADGISRRSGPTCSRRAHARQGPCRSRAVAVPRRH